MSNKAAVLTLSLHQLWFNLEKPDMHSATEILRVHSVVLITRNQELFKKQLNLTANYCQKE